MKVVVTGAAGNVGRSVLEALDGRDEVSEVVGLTHLQPVRPPWSPARTQWVDASVTSSDLEPLFRGADAVIHLAWATQPSHDPAKLARINVDGSRRVFDAVAAAGVPKLIYASSVGAYSSAPKDHLIDEDWPLGSGESSFHANYIASIEGDLDEFESSVPGIKVIRLRPALTFKGEAAVELCRLLIGPFIPSFLLRKRLLPAIPRLSGLCFQALHTSDLGDAYARATIRDVRGAFNLASNPPLDSDDLAATLDTKSFPLPFSLARLLADLSWRLRLQPTPPDWLDMVMRLPLMSSQRANRELGWEPQVTATEALADLVAELRSGKSRGTPGAATSRGGGLERQRPAREQAEEQLVDRLADADSLGRQAVPQLKRALQVAGDGQLAAIFEAHLGESEDQARRLSERLDARDGDTPVLDRSAGGIGIAVFAASRLDTPAKLIAHAFSYEHMQIAANERLRAAAEEAGDEAIAKLARELGEEGQRRADQLEASFDLAVAASLDGHRGKEDLSALLDRCLADVHAIEKQGLQLLEIGMNVTEDDGLRRFFAAHLSESEEQAESLYERLEARGAEPGKAKDAVLQISTMQVGALLAVQPDTEARLVRLASAFEQLEIAAYELLERIARRAGDERIASVARRILIEERAAVRALAQAAAGS